MGACYIIKMMKKGHNVSFVILLGTWNREKRGRTQK